MGRLHTAVAILTYAIAAILVFDTIAILVRHRVFADLREFASHDDREPEYPA